MKRRMMLGLVSGVLLCLAGIAGADRYVATNGAHSDSFTNWAVASTSIQAAINAATNGEAIWVSNGAYYVSAPIEMSKTNILKSVNGAQFTIVDGSSTTRIFYLNNPGAVVDGFTITNAVTTGNGGGFQTSASGGIVRNCIIGHNTAGAGGAGHMQSAAALVEDCDVYGNTAVGNHGGGFFLSGSGGVIRRCTISNNYAVFYGGGVHFEEPALTGYIENSIIVSNRSGQRAGGVMLNGGGTMRNCLLTRNLSASGGGFYGRYVNYKGVGAGAHTCTIVSNTATLSGGGGYLGDSMNENCLINSVIWSNAAASYFDVAATGANTNAFRYCCAQFTVPPQPNAGNISSDPQFVNPAVGDYRLLPGSPCVNAGTNLPWMDAAVDLDGHARLDRFTRQADMGCWEYVYRGSVISLR